ncbi:MAG: hypothetical protein ACOCV3_00480 [Halanaerobiales bacterium]
MDRLRTNILNISANASGAASAARMKNIVMVVDVIDMSTTAETVLQGGADVVYGASPDNMSPPVKINPQKIGYLAGVEAYKNQKKIILVAEPRTGKTGWSGLNAVKKGIKSAGGKIEKIIPNLGQEVQKLACFKGKIVIVVSSAGGVVFDAAFNGGSPAVITGTIASCGKLKGNAPAQKGVNRAIRLAGKYNTGVSIIAASSRAIEDVLAAEFIANLIIKTGFLNINN